MTRPHQADNGIGLPWSADLAGRLDEHVVDSVRLVGNPLGDAASRPLWVYVPPGYDDEPGRRYPSVYVIQGYTGQVAMWANRTAFRQPFPHLLDASVAAGQTPPAIVVYVDAWTALGGSQYLDSPAVGDYHSYLCDEVVGWVDAHYRTGGGRDWRVITGKSSGGYGAMVTAILRPDLFAGFATHAGDSLFEIVCPPLFAQAARLLRDRYDGRYQTFFDDLRTRVFGTRDGDSLLIEVYGYAAAYSADPDGTVRLPFDTTGRLIPEVWRRWLDHDPVVMAGQPRYAAALRDMRAIWIDAGRRDEYYLDLGAAAFRQAVADAGVPDERVRFELFDATHAGIEYRYTPAIAWLLRTLQAG
ncbi:MAG TPA: alpha/beta hydrolase-fold protein [Micromonosporaceae bacterium]